MQHNKIRSCKATWNIWNVWRSWWDCGMKTSCIGRVKKHGKGHYVATRYFPSGFCSYRFNTYKEAMQCFALMSENGQ